MTNPPVSTTRLTRSHRMRHLTFALPLTLRGPADVDMLGAGFMPTEAFLNCIRTMGENAGLIYESSRRRARPSGGGP